MYCTFSIHVVKCKPLFYKMIYIHYGFLTSHYRYVVFLVYGMIMVGLRPALGLVLQILYMHSLESCVVQSNRCLE